MFLAAKGIGVIYLDSMLTIECIIMVYLPGICNRVVGDIARFGVIIQQRVAEVEQL